MWVHLDGLGYREAVSEDLSALNAGGLEGWSLGLDKAESFLVSREEVSALRGPRTLVHGLGSQGSRELGPKSCYDHERARVQG